MPQNKLKEHLAGLSLAYHFALLSFSSHTKASHKARAKTGDSLYNFVSSGALSHSNTLLFSTQLKKIISKKIQKSSRYL